MVSCAVAQPPGPPAAEPHRPHRAASTYRSLHGARWLSPEPAGHPSPDAGAGWVRQGSRERSPHRPRHKRQDHEGIGERSDPTRETFASERKPEGAFNGLLRGEDQRNRGERNFAPLRYPGYSGHTYKTDAGGGYKTHWGGKAHDCSLSWTLGCVQDCHAQALNAERRTLGSLNVVFGWSQPPDARASSSWSPVGSHGQGGCRSRATDFTCGVQWHAGTVATMMLQASVRGQSCDTGRDVLALYWRLALLPA